ncbi:MAG: NAD(P)-binding domain-containing protein, partial [Dehalococcoidia bacterium]|nr:NAD(P)-binding domain-containing protein [Dehalococcoidia bacterium]
MTKMYYDEDADLGLLKGKTIGVIGFGSQGHAHALNLKDSGCDVIVGLYPGSKSWKAVEESGLRVGNVREVAELADVIMILTPDQVAKQVYEQHIA